MKEKLLIIIPAYNEEKRLGDLLKRISSFISLKNVLVVDDQIGMLETFTDILEDRGFDVVTADDGFSAIRKVKEQSFDLIFMDIKMPGITGVQTFREIKKMN